MADVSILQDLAEVRPDAAVVVPYFEDDDLGDTHSIAAAGGEQLRRALERGSLRSRLYHMTLLQPPYPFPALLFVGAGRRADLGPLALTRVSAAGSRYLTSQGFTSVAIFDRRTIDARAFAHAAVVGAITGAYDPGLLKSVKHDVRLLRLVNLVSPANRSDLERGADLGRLVGEAKSMARDLVNLPPNEITPSALAVRARELAEQHRLEYGVLDADAMQEQGMGALLGVARGSDEPPRLVTLRYASGLARRKLAFVGKGLTFDSGGLSLKTAEGMETMKSDMSGAAAVIAGMVAIARLGPSDVDVRGYVGATENMPGGRAMRPGDVLTAMNGETIEVLNTDAEGRLVLADVLAYAVRQGATHLVDLATLTGGAITALGDAATLAAGRPGEWVNEVVAAAEEGLERAWPMPLYPEYREAMRSDVADIKNSGGRAASPLTAAAFLSDFVGELPWAHLDIAGTAWSSEEKPYRAKGGTGEGVGTIVSLACARSEE